MERLPNPDKGRKEIAMFDVNKFALPRFQKISEVLNYALMDMVSHGHQEYRGLRFVSRGNETAYLNSTGHKGALCVNCCEGDLMFYIYWHPSRDCKEAYEMSATDDGCRLLAGDNDMEEDRIWVNPREEPYSPPRLGSGVGNATGAFDVVLLLKKYYKLH